MYICVSIVNMSREFSVRELRDETSGGSGLAQRRLGRCSHCVAKKGSIREVDGRGKKTVETSGAVLKMRGDTGVRQLRDETSGVGSSAQRRLGGSSVCVSKNGIIGELE